VSSLTCIHSTDRSLRRFCMGLSYVSIRSSTAIIPLSLAIAKRYLSIFKRLGVIFSRRLGSGLGFDGRDITLTKTVWITCPTILLFLLFTRLRSRPVPCFFTALHARQHTAGSGFQMDISCVGGVDDTLSASTWLAQHVLYGLMHLQP
jgi:hypothetical protein